ncbi:MAG: uridine kinase [Candidatus Izemoplasmatales bacterium]|nr:uridine kinase [Candidatus Izemoplasmatales bacterium]
MSKPVIIAVAGGSSSGKTTVVNKIMLNFNAEKIEVIRHDDYYKDESDKTIEERRKINYDHPLSLDNDLFYKHVLDLINNKPVDKPTYDFVELNRTKVTEKVYPAEIIILEGILVLEDERIRNLADIKIFVEADDDIRLIRRIKRDTAERGRTLDHVLNQYLSTVKPMHHAFVKPTKRYADIIIPNDYSHDVAVDLIKAKIITILNK